MSFQDRDQPSSDKKRRVCIGKIAAVHGVKGLVKIAPYGDDVTLLERAEAVYTSEDGPDTLKIKLKNPQKQFYLAEIDGVNDRNASEILIGTLLYIDRDQLPEIEEEDTWYYEDLIGLKAIDKNGKEIGRVIAVDNFGAGDLLEIRPLSGQDFYLPFTKENVLNVTEQEIRISIPEGLQE